MWQSQDQFYEGRPAFKMNGTRATGQPWTVNQSIKSNQNNNLNLNWDLTEIELKIGHVSNYKAQHYDSWYMTHKILIFFLIKNKISLGQKFMGRGWNAEKLGTSFKIT